MKILIIGLGSIAKRHILNIRAIVGDNAQITVLRRGIGKPVSEDLGKIINRVCVSDDELDAAYDAVFVTNPTAMHYETLKKYRHISSAFFVEKPVFVTGEEDCGFLHNDYRKYYVASPLRYCNVIQWVKHNIDFSRVHSMRVISSSYLPDWRPGTDYRDTYSAHREMGGGVGIDLIHEWDYICYLIGFPMSVQSLIRKKSDLEIDSDDIALYIAEYQDKTVEVHLDYFGRKTVRKLELYMDEDTVEADLVNQRISWMVSGRELDLSEDRDSYQKKELRHFFDIIDGKIDSDNTIEEACRVLRISRGVG